jgi:hypothetical protein
VRHVPVARSRDDHLADKKERVERAERRTRGTLVPTVPYLMNLGMLPQCTLGPIFPKV